MNIIWYDKIIASITAKKLFIGGFFIALLMVYADLFTKNYIYFLLHNNLSNPFGARQIKITEFFSLIYVNNNGISFGMFNNIENAKQIFVVLQGSIALFLYTWLWRAEHWHIAIALGLIIGGAFGNVLDRYQNGGVTDFLDFHIGSYHWPAFNLADSVIFIGVCIILFEELILRKK